MIEYKEKLEPLINKTVLFMDEHREFPPSNEKQHALGFTGILIIIGCVFSIAFLSVVVFAIFRVQIRRKQEYQRAAKAQVSSTRNAGIYMDLAMDNPVAKSNLPINVPIYNSMKKRQDQYTFISDDELDL